MVEYDRLIAQTALKIDAIKLWPKDGPFLWASGYHMPIYNDNRRFLGDAAHRMMIAEGMKKTIDDEGISFDYVAGTSTAGIAPAASLAQLIDVPLAIQHEYDVYLFDAAVLSVLGIRSEMGISDLVVSTCPFGIPPAVREANNKGKPFAYVRQKKKDHGLGKQIEGTIYPGQEAHIFDIHQGDSYIDVAQYAVEEAGAIVRSSSSCRTSGLLEPIDVSGRRILQIEDLVSTGGSCVKEIEEYRKRGAQVTHCISIFSYGLEKALEEFDAAEVNLLPLLTYPVLLEEAVAAKVIPKDSVEMLADWRAAPFAWGEKNGYPPVKK
ncbi:MAG: hypothetical protein V1729_06755 [Candidatus Woesearchaeota archaeon]